MLTIITFFIILSILVIIHELGHFIAAKKNNVFVEEFGFGLPPRIFGIKHGETLYSLNLLPFGGFVKVLGEEEHELDKKKLPPELQKRTFVSKSAGVKILILTAGVAANFILGWGIVSYLFTQGVPVPTNKIIIESVANNSPAQNVGIQKNDVIRSITTLAGTKKLASSDEFITRVREAKGEQVSLSVERNGTLRDLTLTPRINPPRGEGSLGVVLTQFVIKKYPWYQSPFYGLLESANITYQIIKELGKTLLHFLTFQKTQVDVAGPIGIAKITDQAVKVGYMAVLQLLGLLSLNLAVINILPFPALDGGRLAFVLYETIFRRKINPNIERRLNMAGFAILLSLIGLVTINDILKIFVK